MLSTKEGKYGQARECSRERSLMGRWLDGEEFRGLGDLGPEFESPFLGLGVREVAACAKNLSINVLKRAHF